MCDKRVSEDSVQGDDSINPALDRYPSFICRAWAVSLCLHTQEGSRVAGYLLPRRSVFMYINCREHQAKLERWSEDG
jgi:hypothetical protein